MKVIFSILLITLILCDFSTYARIANGNLKSSDGNEFLIYKNEVLPRDLDECMHILDSTSTSYDKRRLQGLDINEIPFGHIYRLENTLLERLCLYYKINPSELPREFLKRRFLKMDTDIYKQILGAYIRFINNQNYKEIFDYEAPNSIQDLQDLIDNGIWNTSILNKDIDDEKFNYIFGKNIDERPSPLYKEIVSVSDSLLTYWDIRNIIKEAADTNKNTENKSLRQLIDANVNLAKELNEHAKEQYNERVRADSIDGIYIPVNLTDACQELDKMLDNETKEEIIRLGKDFGSVAHHTLGMWIRNNWGLWGGSRLQAYLRDKGYSDPDEMSDYLLTCYQFWLESKAKSDE